MKKIFPAVMLSALILLPASAHGNEKMKNTSEYQFSVKIDSAKDGIEIEMELSNQSQKKLTFEFPSSQMYEILIKDDKGKLMYTYSKDRSFLQSIQRVELEPGDEKIWYEKWGYNKNDGTKLAPGQYKLEVNLLPVKINGLNFSKQKFKSEKRIKIDLVQKNFRHVTASGAKGRYVVKGEVMSTTGRFFYTVDDGHNEFLAGKKLTENQDGKWESFKIVINVPKNQLPKDGTLILSLFADGNLEITSQQDDNNVILETFRSRNPNELNNN